jgi:hypothetical protein
MENEHMRIKKILAKMYHFEESKATRIPKMRPEIKEIVAIFQFAQRFIISKKGMNNIITIKARCLVTIRNLWSIKVFPKIKPNNA